MKGMLFQKHIQQNHVSMSDFGYYEVQINFATGKMSMVGDHYPELGYTEPAQNQWKKHTSVSHKTISRDVGLPPEFLPYTCHLRSIFTVTEDPLMSGSIVAKVATFLGTTVRAFDEEAIGNHKYECSAGFANGILCAVSTLSNHKVKWPSMCWNCN